MSDYQWPERFWPHQLTGCLGVVKAIANGNRRIVLTSPTGGGKTDMMTSLIQWASSEWWDSALYTNRRLLFDQTSAVLTKGGIEHGLRAAGHKPALLKRVQLCMTPSEYSAVYKKNRRELHPSQLSMVDEVHCFVADTQISTPKGNVSIQHVHPGDIIHTGCGLGVVQQTMASAVGEFVRLEFSDGREVSCTCDHRVFTTMGWQFAGAMGLGSVALCKQGVSSLWRDILPTADDPQGPGTRRYNRDGGGAVERASDLLAILLQEAEESYAQKVVFGQGVGDLAEDWAQADSERRQRKATPASAIGLAECARRGVAGRVCCANTKAKRLRVSDLLQDRHCQPKPKDCDRSGRGFPQQPEEAGDGCQEGGTPDCVRLVRVSRIKCPRTETVYNLQVSGHPSYFANGLLVHNCQNGGMMQQILGDLHAMGSNIVAVTATPLDLEGEWDELIVAGTNSELRACGALVPAYVYCPDQPDLRHVKNYRVGEDLTDGQNNKVMMRPGVFGRVYKHWCDLNPDRLPTLLFGPDVAGSIFFAEEFHKKGVRSAHIDAKQIWHNGEYLESDDDTRHRILKMTETGEIEVLCNRFVLREGINLPHIAVGILATVFGSLKTYLQSVGRILRAHDSLERVTIIDHGGNYVRHGSPNENRVWELGMKGYRITGERQEVMRERPELEPIICPKCGMGRLSGPTCLACGYSYNKRSRMVVQVDGKLKLVEGPSYRKRYRKERSDTEEKWIQMFHRAKSKKWNATFRQAEALFCRENRYYPPQTLPMMPIDPQDWWEKVADVPLERLR